MTDVLFYGLGLWLGWLAWTFWPRALQTRNAQQGPQTAPGASIWGKELPWYWQTLLAACIGLFGLTCWLATLIV